LPDYNNRENLRFLSIEKESVKMEEKESVKMEEKEE
jgi:hypothetical protein